MEETKVTPKLFLGTASFASGVLLLITAASADVYREVIPVDVVTVMIPVGVVLIFLGLLILR